jgi:hypothetical protein
MLLVIISVVVLLYILFAYHGVIQSGGEPDSDNHTPTRTVNQEPSVRQARLQYSRPPSPVPVEQHVEKLDTVIRSQNVTIDRNTKKLENISQNLSRKGELNESEHEVVRKIAEKTNDISDAIEAVGKQIKSQIKELENKQVNMESDIKLVRNLQIGRHPVQEQRYYEDEVDDVDFGDHIHLTKNVLGNHNGRLKKLEKNLCAIRSDSRKSTDLLREINSRLKTHDVSNENARTDDEIGYKREQVRKTTSSIDYNCPASPLYAKIPTGILEVGGYDNNAQVRQGYGEIVPANS